MELHAVPTRPVESYPARLVAATTEHAFDVVFTSQTTYLLQAWHSSQTLLSREAANGSQDCRDTTTAARLES